MADAMNGGKLGKKQPKRLLFAVLYIYVRNIIRYEKCQKIKKIELTAISQSAILKLVCNTSDGVYCNAFQTLKEKPNEHFRQNRRKPP